MATTARDAPIAATRRTGGRRGSARRATAGRDAAAAQSLVDLIEAEIVPRLLVAHRVDGEAPVPAAVLADTHLPDIAVRARAAIGAESVDQFMLLVLLDDLPALIAHVDRLMAAGAELDAVMVDLLAPTARQLGLLWEEDRCDFVEVTLGLWRLQEVVRHLSSRARPWLAVPLRRALFTAFPGDDHDFGAVIVADTFRRAGWAVDRLVRPDMTGLLAAAAHDSYDLIGLSISRDADRALLPSTVLALRSVSCNPRVQVIIGGRVPNEDPALVLSVGADGCAPDAVQALRLAETLVDRAAVFAACV